MYVFEKVSPIRIWAHLCRFNLSWTQVFADHVPLWLSGKCSQPFGCFVFTSIIKHGSLGTSGCLGGYTQNTQRNIQTLGWVLHMGHLSEGQRPENQKASCSLRYPSCNWTTLEFTRSKYIHLNVDPFLPLLPQLTRGTRKLTNHELEPQDKKVNGDGHPGSFSQLLSWMF